MKHYQRTQCQHRLQNRLFTELSDLMMRRRGHGASPLNRLACHPCSVAYPWRLYDLLVELARANVTVLVSAGDNLHQTLVAARQCTLDHVEQIAKQKHSVLPIPHIPLRSPTWLHTRVLLAAMIEVECARSECARSGESIAQSVWGRDFDLLRRCQGEIGISLVQLAEGFDQVHQFSAELFQATGATYMQLGRQVNESSS